MFLFKRSLYFVTSSFRHLVNEQESLTVCHTGQWSTYATTVGGSTFGSSGSNSSLLNTPSNVYIDNNTIYVTDNGNYRVQRFLSNSIIGTTIISGSYGAALNQFYTSDIFYSFDDSFCSTRNLFSSEWNKYGF